jgi:hypothetical protein
MRTARSGGGPTEQRFYRFFITLQMKLDGTVTSVPDPSGDAQPRGFAPE